MAADLFISYAWTSTEHREWVRLFASQLHLIGYNVKIDETVDYGSSLSGFMQEITDSSHVLLIIDENYVSRANDMPDSGVGIENKWIGGVFSNKPANWLSVVFVRNPENKLPAWLIGHNPKGFNFNARPEKNEFAGAAQVDAVWRWVEGLPANKANAVTLAEIRKRATRIERADALRNPANYANPALNGRITFQHKNQRYFTVGQGEFEFKIKFAERSHNSIYVYFDNELKALGLITIPNYDRQAVDSFLTPARAAEPVVGQSVVLMNTHGLLCIITIDEVQSEVNSTEYIPPHVTFSYEVLTGL
ncbi:toll/interleukin-1 receptor domain-containing protein [Mucilaginibacter sp. dw_454]|uniref:toll/interleukin-1 receptor domain-containing protein n=1 Tax=Mucilaginibacter sp. dw_454 TaxID=2720079 RepID=UPI001BD35D40|nr:toll/interleukin-1 receptor domain-containing protein [Mucilaginibacter sp. dw_454]